MSMILGFKIPPAFHNNEKISSRSPRLEIFSFLLHDMDGKASELAVQIHVFNGPVLVVGGGVHVEGKALFL